MRQLLCFVGILMFLLTACGGASSANESAIRPAPDFTLPNALGGDVSLSDYAGQPVLLYFHMAVG